MADFTTEHLKTKLQAVVFSTCHQLVSYHESIHIKATVSVSVDGKELCVLNFAVQEHKRNNDKEAYKILQDHNFIHKTTENDHNSSTIQTKDQVGNSAESTYPSIIQTNEHDQVVNSAESSDNFFRDDIISQYGNVMSISLLSEVNQEIPESLSNREKKLDACHENIDNSEQMCQSEESEGTGNSACASNSQNSQKLMDKNVSSGRIAISVDIDNTNEGSLPDNVESFQELQNANAGGDELFYVSGTNIEGQDKEVSPHCQSVNNVLAEPSNMLCIDKSPRHSRNSINDVTDRLLLERKKNRISQVLGTIVKLEPETSTELSGVLQPPDTGELINSMLNIVSESPSSAMKSATHAGITITNCDQGEEENYENPVQQSKKACRTPLSKILPVSKSVSKSKRKSGNKLKDLGNNQSISPSLDEGSQHQRFLTMQCKLNDHTYQCLLCMRTFTLQTNLTRHQKTVHGKPRRRLGYNELYDEEQPNTSTVEDKLKKDIPEFPDWVENTENCEKKGKKRKLDNSSFEEEEQAVTMITGISSEPSEEGDPKFPLSIVMDTENDICDVTVEPSTFALIQDLLIPGKFKSKYQTVKDVKGLYVCPLCDRKFGFPTNLHRHLKTNHDGARLDRVSLDKDSYTLAIKKPTEPVLASSPSPKSVSKYSQLKDQKGKYMCPLCTNKFAFTTNLRRHMRTLHSNVVFDGVINATESNEEIAPGILELAAAHSEAQGDAVNELFPTINNESDPESKHHLNLQRNTDQRINTTRSHKRKSFCNMCGQNCFSVSNVYIHKKLVHTAKGKPMKTSQKKTVKNILITSQSNNPSSRITESSGTNKKLLDENNSAKDTDIDQSLEGPITSHIFLVRSDIMDTSVEDPVGENSTNNQSSVFSGEKPHPVFSDDVNGGDNLTENDGNDSREQNSDQSLNNLRATADPRRRFHCFECQKTFTFRTNLTRHIRQVHKNEHAKIDESDKSSTVHKKTTRPILPAPIASKKETTTPMLNLPMHIQNTPVLTGKTQNPTLLSPQDNQIPSDPCSSFIIEASRRNFISLQNCYSSDVNNAVDIPKNYSDIYPIENTSDSLGSRLLSNIHKDQNVLDYDVRRQENISNALLHTGNTVRLSYPSQIPISYHYNHSNNANYYSSYRTLLDNCSPIVARQGSFGVGNVSGGCVSGVGLPNNDYCSSSEQRNIVGSGISNDKNLSLEKKSRNYIEGGLSSNNSSTNKHGNNSTCVDSSGNISSNSEICVNLSSQQHDSLNSQNSSASAMIDVVNVSHENSSSNMEQSNNDGGNNNNSGLNIQHHRISFNNKSSNDSSCNEDKPEISLSMQERSLDQFQNKDSKKLGVVNTSITPPSEPANRSDNEVVNNVNSLKCKENALEMSSNDNSKGVHISHEDKTILSKSGDVTSKDNIRNEFEKENKKISPAREVNLNFIQRRDNNSVSSPQQRFQNFNNSSATAEIISELERFPVLGFYDMLSPAKSVTGVNVNHLDSSRLSLQFSPSQSPLSSKSPMSSIRSQINTIRSPTLPGISHSPLLSISPLSSTPLFRSSNNLERNFEGRRLYSENIDTNFIPSSISACSSSNSLRNQYLSSMNIPGFRAGYSMGSVQQDSSNYAVNQDKITCFEDNAVPLKTRTISRSSSQDEFVDISKLMKTPEKFGLSKNAVVSEHNVPVEKALDSTVALTSEYKKSVAPQNINCKSNIRRHSKDIHSKKLIPQKTSLNVSTIQSINVLPEQNRDNLVAPGRFTANKYRFNCKICPAKFTFRTNLTRHMKKQHGVTPSEDIDL